jgi:hypothetical protein
MRIEPSTAMLCFVWKISTAELYCLKRRAFPICMIFKVALNLAALMLFEVPAQETARILLTNQVAGTSQVFFRLAGAYSRRRWTTASRSARRWRRGCARCRHCGKWSRKELTSRLFSGASIDCCGNTTDDRLLKLSFTCNRFALTAPGLL